MRILVLGIVILMAVPAYAVGQQRQASERSATGRTASPREAPVQPAPPRQADRRAEPRTEPEPEAAGPPEKTSGDAAPPRAGREPRHSPTGGETARGRSHDRRPQAAPARSSWTNWPGQPPTVLSGLGFRGAQPPTVLSGLGFQPAPEREHPQRDGDDRRRYRRPHDGPNVVFVPYPSPVVVEREVFVETAAEPVVPVVAEPPPLARLILDIQPPVAQVFADGYYIGMPEDFRAENGGALLEPGPHRIDILARDYEPVTFDVNLTRGQSATFRHVLTPRVRAPQRVAAPPPPMTPKQPVTFYLIPGCYMGNVPPKDANLPATCDIARAVAFQY